MSEKKRILFVGELHSSHAQSWIELLRQHEDMFSIAGASSSEYPADAPFQIYAPLGGTSLATSVFRRFLRKRYQRYTEKIRPFYVHGEPSLPLASLMRALKNFRPHIVHTFGFMPGALLYMCVPKTLRTGIRWVHQFRGGPDLTHSIYNSKTKSLLQYVTMNCDYCICDNELNISLVKELGIDPTRLTERIYPGTGGVDVPLGPIMPLSERKRVIVWPKAYTCVQSDAYPVLEALRFVLQALPDVELVALAVTPDVAFWIKQILKDYSARMKIHTRIPREENLRLLLYSRIMLAPSLSEGIPNSLYEAMASGCIPVVSPLPTITPHFKEGVNVFYARNLFPDEIAAALFKAFDDSSCEGMQDRNLEKVGNMANRTQIAHKVVQLYSRLASTHHNDTVSTTIHPEL